MHYIPDNLKFLRRSKGWTQDQFAHHLGVKRSLIGAYEEGRADPRISFLLLVCQKFDLSMDALVGQPLDVDSDAKSTYSGIHLRILPIAIDKSENTERATLVPVKAAAGYLNGYGDVEFIEQLSVFDLPYPEVSKGRTYRIFQIKGDSMLPVKPGDYIIGSYVMDWSHVKNDQCYIVVSKSEGIVFKRLLNNLNEGSFRLKSDNSEYESYDLAANDVLEIWKAEGITTFDVQDTLYQNQDISQELKGIKEELAALKKRIG